VTACEPIGESADKDTDCNAMDGGELIVVGKDVDEIFMHLYLAMEEIEEETLRFRVLGHIETGVSSDSMVLSGLSVLIKYISRGV
jgi:hypothetical protein